MKNNKWLYLAAAIGALIVFQITYSFKTVDPTNVNWLMTVRDDWGTHYLGWFFYRNEPWTFPLGNISNYYYSIGTNVGFTDSIPLMAIFFKLFSPLLPANFQYFGIWFLLCDLLLAFYTVKLLQLFRVRPVNIFLSVLFVVANPVLVYRGQHPALCAHWLLIGSLYLYFLDPKTVRPRTILTHQLVLLLVSAAVNPYLCCMVLGLTLAVAIKLYRYDRVTGKKDFIRYLATCLSGILLVWFLIGLINFKKKDELGVGGAYGLYSMNLNALYNPNGWSTFLNAGKQVSWHQFEGFMYLGLGVLLLVLIVLIHALYGLVSRRGKGSLPDLRVNGTYFIPLLVLMILFALFAITQNISFNDRVLLRVPIPRFLTNLGDIFRASGRFFWLPYYTLWLFTLIAISRFRIWWPLGSFLLLSALILQGYDTKHLLGFRRYPSGIYTPPLNKSWAKLISQFDHLVFYPPFVAHQLVRMDYQDFSWLAATQRKTINIGYVARGDGSAMRTYSDSLGKALEDGQVSPKTLYVTTPNYLRHFALLLQSGLIQLHYLDGYYYLTAKGIRNQQLDTLNARLDAAARDKLDSALSVVRKKTIFTPAGEISGSATTPIRYYLERVNKGRGYISLEGWGFLDSTQNNKGDSIYFTLSSVGGSFWAPAKIGSRPDLTDGYHRAYLGDGGFSLLAFYDSMPAGDYQLGIAIKDQQGRRFYQQDSNKIKVIGF